MITIVASCAEGSHLTPKLSRLRVGTVRPIVRQLCQQGILEKRGGSNSATATCWAAFGDGKERCRPCLDDPFSFCGYSTGPNSFPWLCLEYLLIFAATQPGKTVCSGFVLNTCFRFAATPPSKIAFFGPVFILPFTDWLSTRPGKTDFV